MDYETFLVALIDVAKIAYPQKFESNFGKQKSDAASFNELMRTNIAILDRNI